MKLFLTSAGLSNDSITKIFIELVDLPKDKINIAFVPTAANVEEGDKGWLIEDLTNFKNLGFSVDLVDISAIDKDIWQPRLEAANVLFFGGGNTLHLMHWMKKSGLEEILPELLKTRVYAGISAGSCVAGPTVYNSVQNLFGEKYELVIKEGLGLVDFQFIPHLNSEYFTKIREENLNEAAKKIKEPIYALDDNSALRIVDGKIEVISEGEYLVLNS